MEQTTEFSKTFSWPREEKEEAREITGLDEEIASLLLDMREKCEESVRKESLSSPALVKSFGLNDFTQRNAVKLEEGDNQFCQVESRLKRKLAEDVEEHDDAEYEEEEDDDESEWRHNDEELDDEDDEWMESRTGSHSPSSPSSGSRITRKKAPSGSACEKHKRWKKRCPDDCPMRKQKSKRRISEKQADTGSIDNCQSPLNGRSNMSAHYKGTDEQSVSSPDYYTLIQWSMLQLRKESKCEDSLETKADSEVLKIQIDGRYKRRKTEAKVVLIGPTPRNSTTSSSPAGRSRQSLRSTEDVMENLSSSSSEENRSKFGYFEDAFEYELPTRARKARTSTEKRKTTKGRGVRKYLPQACDRHKLLHAKCPANCPDRLKRDAELKVRASSSPILA